MKAQLVRVTKQPPIQAMIYAWLDYRFMTRSVIMPSFRNSLFTESNPSSKYLVILTTEERHYRGAQTF